MIRYAFKDAPVTIKAGAKADPQKIGEELAAISAANGGRLTPKSVVEKAANPRHPLHRFFEWDDAKAANAHRLEQARELIRIIRVDDDDGKQVRAFFSINDRGTSYRSLTEVRQSQGLQELVLKSALKDLRAWEARYRDLTDACDLVRQAQRKVGARLKTADAQAAAA